MTSSVMTRMPRRVGLLEQAAEIVQRAEGRVDRGVVGDVVAAVAHRRGIKRQQPDRGDAQVAQVVELADQPGKVADAVAVRIGRRRARGSRRPPPRGTRAGWAESLRWCQRVGGARTDHESSASMGAGQSTRQVGLLCGSVGPSQCGAELWANDDTDLYRPVRDPFTRNGLAVAGKQNNEPTDGRSRRGLIVALETRLDQLVVKGFG